MIEYIYKGFKISYNIVPAEIEKNTYKADGTAIYLFNKLTSCTPKKFHTEYVTRAGTEHEIKRLLENYVDFELKNFYDMQKDKGKRRQVSEQAV